MNDFYLEFCSSKPQIDSDVLLSRAFRSFSYNELRDLLKQVSLSDLAEALKNVREKLVIQVMDFLDRESSRWLMKELMKSGDSDDGFEKVKEAQLKILGIFASKKRNRPLFLSELKKNGRIARCHRDFRSSFGVLG